MTAPLISPFKGVFTLASVTHNNIQLSDQILVPERDRERERQRERQRDRER